MIKQGLLGEFLHEAENTRKLLNMVPDSALDYRPQPHLWSVAELASHIAAIYGWYSGTFNVDEFDFATYHYEREDFSKAANIVRKFEENVAKAQKAIEDSDESTYFNDWILKAGGQIFIGPMPKMSAIRGFLYNHLYHHRGELVAHLRATGNKVPGLYGPAYEASQGK
ncbi:damage-inducible protein DinB [Pedobacter sp. BS3]|uniref:DinB family protein n=1 Tax=Pedobacter sp. BS3 TaxID=2567937 RepID=UPI0011EFF213|nr:DinB family protein [Pedobacter sp. BS3]TZF82651.1 damage-inducible protein DinB [Pedobacter sp. BS3]